MKYSLWSHPKFNGTLRLAYEDEFLHTVSYVRPQEFWEHSAPPPKIKKLIDWLEAYAESPLKSPPAPLDPKYRTRGTKYQENVWNTLIETVKPGETIGYQELGIRAGYSPQSSRAIGTAVGKNPFLILIPCHRVIPQSGKIGGFSGHGGSDCKRFLLKHEGTVV